MLNKHEEPDAFFRSSLENYTSNNTRQHGHNARQHEYNTRQHEHTTSTTLYNTRQHEYNTSIIPHNTSTTRPNRSTKEALAAKIGLYFRLFVTELHIFLISFRIN